MKRTHSIPRLVAPGELFTLLFDATIRVQGARGGV